MLFGVLLSYKYHTQCWISYKSRESELSISMSFAAREVITPGQQEICNPYQLLAPRMHCFAGTLIVFVSKSSVTTFLQRQSVCGVNTLQGHCLLRPSTLSAQVACLSTRATGLVFSDRNGGPHRLFTAQCRLTEAESWLSLVEEQLFNRAFDYKLKLYPCTSIPAGFLFHIAIFSPSSFYIFKPSCSYITGFPRIYFFQ